MNGYMRQRFLFLMHRVELKGKLAFDLILNKQFFFLVPNAPCGVERNARQLNNHSPQMVFLMHRVELKERCGGGVLC